MMGALQDTTSIYLQSHHKDMASIFDAVVMEESAGNPLAASIKGARGLMQITQPAIDDYNTYNRQKMTMDDMWDSGKNKTVGEWYLADRIPKMLKAYKLPVTTENILWAYNAGIGNVVKGIKPKETVAYIDKVMGRVKEK